VQERTGEELTQGYFDTLVTELEAKHGDLHTLLIREARGSFYIPHQGGGATPLGTQTVREFRRPAWTFNKIVVIEKEDLRLMLEQSGWAERNDALLMSAKGFNTRAARDLIDKNAETTEPL
jgi:DNA topoisomerase VI subunit A